MDDRTPSIAVIVPMFNAADRLSPLLESLLAQTYEHSWELVLVDNGSWDGTAAVARARLADGRSSLVRHQVVEWAGMRGHASPRNHGVSLSTAPLLAFCDADDSVAPGWLEAIVAALGRDPLVSSAHFRQLVGDAPQDHMITEVDGQPGTKLGYPIAATCGMACTRELFENLGGFDTHFDTGGADADFSIRSAIQLRITPVLAPDALYFVTPGSGVRSAFRQGYRYGRSRARLLQRHAAHVTGGRTGPTFVLRRAATLIRRAPRLRQASRRPAISRAFGIMCGRLVWSTRLRVRSF